MNAHTPKHAAGYNGKKQAGGRRRKAGAQRVRLSPKQELFVAAVVGGATYSKAAALAGFSTPGTHAFFVSTYKLRHNPKIQQAIADGRRMRARQLVAAVHAGRRVDPRDLVALLNKGGLPSEEKAAIAACVLSVGAELLGNLQVGGK